MKLAQAQLTGGAEDRDVYFAPADMDTRAKQWKDASLAVNKAEASRRRAGGEGLRLLLPRLRRRAAEALRSGRSRVPQGAGASTRTTPPSATTFGYMFADRGVHLDEAIALLKKAVAFNPQNGAYLHSPGPTTSRDSVALADDYSHQAVLRHE